MVEASDEPGMVAVDALKDETKSVAEVAIASGLTQPA